MNASPADATVGADVSATSMQMMRGSLVVSLQSELEERWLLRFEQDLLAKIQRRGLRRIILDATAVETMDSVDFRALRRIIDMLALMGAAAVIVGLRPGVVSALMTMDLDVSGLRGAPDLDRGLEMLENMAAEPRKLKTIATNGRHPNGRADSHRR